MLKDKRKSTGIFLFCFVSRWFGRGVGGWREKAERERETEREREKEKCVEEG